MIQTFRPDFAVVGAFEQGHLDHDATHWLVRQTFLGEMREVPLYHSYLRRYQVLNRFSDPAGEAVLRLTAEERRFKVRLARCYPSQSIYRILATHETVARFVSPRRRLLFTERMRAVPPVVDYTSPRHPPELRRRIEGSAKWREWLSALAESSAGER